MVHARPRRRRGRRRERRLRRGLVPAGADDIPTGYATEGTWYDFFAGKAAAGYGVTWGPGFATFQYPNDNRASTIWYHDHTLGMTRLNVYAGPAGFYIVRGGPAGDNAVLDTRSGTPAVLPGPAPKEGDKFPSQQDVLRDPDRHPGPRLQHRRLAVLPGHREFFDGATADDPGFIPATDLSPIWNPEFFGNMIMVNGNTWPFHNVEQRRYRFRFLNGCQSRFLILDFSNIPGVEVWQIGNEGGFLAAPVNLTADNGNQLLMGLAERADIIVDFTNVPWATTCWATSARTSPSAAACPGNRLRRRRPGTPGRSWSSGSVRPWLADPTTPPQFLAAAGHRAAAGASGHPAAGAHRDDGCSTRATGTARPRPCSGPSIRRIDGIGRLHQGCGWSR